MKGVSDVGTKTASTVAGLVNQNLQVVGDVRKTGLLTSSLNAASNTISSTMGLVGNVASSAIGLSGNAAMQTMDAFGSLMKRIVKPSGNAPTPVESYVAMVVKPEKKNEEVA
jgi:hypothetical protein